MNNPIYCSFGRAIFSIILLVILTSGIKSQWAQQTTGTQYPLRSVYFVNTNTGFTVSVSNNISVLMGGEIFRTTNGGNLWQLVLLDSNFRGKGFYFLDENTGFLVGGKYSEIGFIYKTTNNGLNWINVTPPVINTYLNNIVFVNNATGFIGGLSSVFKTTNSGNSWEQVLYVPITFFSPHPKVFFQNSNTGYYIRDTLSVYKTINAGLNWQYYHVSVSPIKGYIKDIKFINDNTGFIIGDSAMIYKSTDQGITWFTVPAGIYQHLFSLNFVNSVTGYITAEHTVLKTTNSGLNWFSVFTQSADTIYSSFFLNPDTGYLCADHGRVYKTTTGGVLGINVVDPSVPVSFDLFQNYPNPFNPSTAIKFSVPISSVVKLSVYDALGREIESLVNEFLLPGTYEISWLAERFSSGIYFYRLLANDFSMVKKMSLIK